MIGNLSEDFMYQRIPAGVIDLDTQGLIQAVCGGLQDRIEDLKSYGKNMQQFFAVNNFPQTGPNVVLVDLQSREGKVYTRSLDLQTDTPADGTAALDAWAAQQLGLEEECLLNVRYGTDLLRLVDISTLTYLAQTIGAVLYQTSILPDDQVQAEQQQIIATYFPRLQIKGTERSFEALGRILGFDDIRMTPLWSRLSVRQPSDVGAAANDPDFATDSEYAPQQFFDSFYNPLQTNDGPFYTWTGTVNNGTSSTQFYTQAVNGFSPFITVDVLSVQYGSVVDPANGAYILGSSGTDSLGGPHKMASVSPPGAGVKFQAIAEGADFNGMVINVGTDSTGTNRILSITDRLSAIKYRSSYFDLAITADPDKIEEILGSSAAQRNKDLTANPALTSDGVAVSPFRPWVGGSFSTASVVRDWVTLTGTAAPAVIIPRTEASAVNRQLNMDSVIAAGVQVTQAFEEVRAATRIPRKSLSGLLLQTKVPYAAYVNVSALALAPVITSVSQTVQALWNVDALIPQSVEALWNVDQLVSQTVQALWDVEVLVVLDAPTLNVSPFTPYGTGLISMAQQPTAPTQWEFWTSLSDNAGEYTPDSNPSIWSGPFDVANTSVSSNWVGNYLSEDWEYLICRYDASGTNSPWSTVAPLPSPP